jgi:hypothetical protein
MVNRVSDVKDVITFGYDVLVRHPEIALLAMCGAEAAHDLRSRSDVQ